MTLEKTTIKVFLKHVGEELSDDTLIQKQEQRLKLVKSNVEWRKEYMKFEADQQLREDKVRKENSLEIAENLLKMGKMNFPEIAKVTGLPLAQIEQLPTNP